MDALRTMPGTMDKMSYNKKEDVLISTHTQCVQMAEEPRPDKRRFTFFLTPPAASASGCGVV